MAEGQYPPRAKQFSFDLEWTDVDRSALDSLIQRARDEERAREVAIAVSQYQGVLISREQWEQMQRALPSETGEGMYTEIDGDRSTWHMRLYRRYDSIDGTVEIWTLFNGERPESRPVPKAFAKKWRDDELAARQGVFLRELRCLHSLDPVTHNCSECSASGEVLELQAQVCIGDGAGHKMHLDYMSTGEYFCDKCGLTEDQIQTLNKPVVAGDEAAARGELTFLPDIDIPGQEDKAE